FLRASSALLATIYSSSQSFPTMYQTGMRCPHHSCLLMHQSLIFMTVACAEGCCTMKNDKMWPSSQQEGELA
ncbi:hypothetical protein E1A91_A03G241500v1, partial [Gossypium mustelinum]